jgi:hypothetical protein
VSCLKGCLRGLGGGKGRLGSGGIEVGDYLVGRMWLFACSNSMLSCASWKNL